MPPSPNGDNGRDGRGRFATGNPGGPGNPFARRVAALRSVVLDAVSKDDLKAIVAKLVEQAKGGDVVAIRELLRRIIGRPTESPDPAQPVELVVRTEAGAVWASELQKIVREDGTLGTEQMVEALRRTPVSLP